MSDCSPPPGRNSRWPGGPAVRYSSSMPRDDEKLLRQLSLVSFLLTQRRPVTPRHVHERVEGYAGMTDVAFVRRFYGDRAELEQAGIRIEGAAGDDEPEAYFLPDDNYHLPAIEFTSEELRALSVALTLLEGRFAYARPLRLALVSLTHGHPDPGEAELERVAVSLAPDEEADSLGPVLAQLDDALARGKTVRFSYPTGPELQPRERMLDPYGLSRAGGHWYVGGWDHDREAQRTFRLSRIDGAIRFATKRPRDFSPPHGVDPADFRTRPPWQLGETRGVATVRVDDEVAWWVARTYPGVENAPSEPDAAGGDGRPIAPEVPSSTIFTTPYADREALVSWVLSLGRRAELLAPPDLRAYVRSRLDVVEAAHRA